MPMDTNKKNKRSRNERNSTEILIDICLTTFLNPYINIKNSRLLYTSFPNNFALSTVNFISDFKEKKKIDNMLAERSPAELLAAINMTKIMKV